MIIVCPLVQARTQINMHKASHAVTLLAPRSDRPVFNGIAPGRHLDLAFHDILAPQDDLIMPEPEHVKQLLNFIESWPRQNPLLIHCFAGVSRSTAAAFIALCALKPTADEKQLAFQLREASPTATPNGLLISYADKLLNRDGAMMAAIAAIGRGTDAFEGTPFAIKL